MKEDNNISDEGQYHLEISEGDIASTVLLPGNPERVEKIIKTWDEGNIVSHHREYRTATGRYKETPISATSTGIGSPSTAIAVEELAQVGADTMIRVGSCGALQPEINIGDLVITSGAVRQEGTSREYVREQYPAVADFEVVSALVAAAERLGHEYHVGLTASTDSFYAGQGRSGYKEYLPPNAEEQIDELVHANVLNFEMETSAILTLANIFDLRAGSICVAYSDRNEGSFSVQGERKVAAVAAEAVNILNSMDQATAKADANYWHPDLETKE